MREIARLHGDLLAGTTQPDTADHELQHGRLIVAVEGDLVLGFGAVLERSGVSYLADLFLLPDRLGRGIGSAIMRELFPDPSERFTFASSDPRALPLYVRFGMLPYTPLLYLCGERSSVMRLPDSKVALEEESLDEVVRMDHRASGRERPEDHTFLHGVGGRAFVARDQGGTLGYGYVRVVPGERGPEALLNPTGAHTEKALARTMMALLRHAVALASTVKVAVLGTQTMLPALLSAGFRVQDRDTLMASTPELLDGSRYCPSPVLG